MSFVENLYVGKYEGKAYCVGHHKREVDAYFQVHRRLNKGDYSIEEVGIGHIIDPVTQEKAMMLIRDGYQIWYQYGLLLPMREMEWIKYDVEEDLVTISEATIPQLLRIESGLKTSDRYKEELEALDTLLDFFYEMNDKDLKRIRRNLIHSHPLVYMNMQEFKEAKHRYLEIKELDDAYRDKLDMED